MRVPLAASVTCARLFVILGAGCLTWRGVRPAFYGQVAPPAPATQTTTGGTWRVLDLSSRGGGLVANLAEAVRDGRAQVESPSGPAPGPNNYVDVRQLTVTNEADPLLGIAGVTRRQWLFTHPPAAVAVDVALPAGREAWFQATLALDPAMWAAPSGDGVDYRVEVTRLDGAPGAPPVEPAAPALQRTLDPRSRVDDRRWVPVAVDLSPWAGGTIRLRLRTLSRDDLTYDWSGWGNPVVFVRDSGRAYPPPATG